MIQSREHIKLTFSCKENLENAPKTAKGDFCSTCQKEVIDFTSMSFSEIQQIRNGQKEMCGKFRAEQLYPELRPIEAPRVRSLAFLSAVFVSLNFNSVRAQSTVDPKIEQSQGTSNTPNLSPQEVKEKTETGQHISMSRATVEEEHVNSVDQKKNISHNREKKWFWSKRFPFIHRRRVIFRGKF